jgi:hypothetical protein
MQTCRYCVAFVAAVVAALSLEGHSLLAQAKDRSSVTGCWT